MWLKAPKINISIHAPGTASKPTSTMNASMIPTTPTPFNMTYPFLLTL